MRIWCSRVVVAAVVVLGGMAGIGAAARRPAAVRVVVSPGQAGGRIPAGYVGLSLEFSAVPWYAGPDAAAVNPVLVRLIRNLTPRGGFVLRIGGDSTDQSWWPVPGASRPPGVRYSLGPEWLATVRSLLAATGGRAILGVNLKSGRPWVAGAEARAFLAGLGRGRVTAFEVGNEPEYYRSGYGAYVRNFSRWRRALPSVGLAGPATGSLPWLSHLKPFLAAEPTVRLVTVHRYGLNDCQTNPRAPTYPSLAHLLSAATLRRVVAGLGSYVDVAHRRGAGFRVDELNSVTCQGELGVSDTFASTLWMLQALFATAKTGVDGVNIHIWPGAAPNQLFTFDRVRGRWLGSVRPAYYALLMFTQAAPPGSRLVSTRVTGAGSVSAWATRATDGSLRVVLINPSLGDRRTAVVRVGCRTGLATVSRLRAASARATNGLTLGGRTVDSTGELAGLAHLASLRPAAGAYRVTLPAASAALLTCSGPLAAMHNRRTNSPGTPFRFLSSADVLTRRLWPATG